MAWVPVGVVVKVNKEFKLPVAVEASYFVCNAGASL
jgi:hypothetical protein